MAGEIMILKREVEKAYPTVRSLGTYNRRKIAGSNSWSQHAYDPPYGWAWDIRPPSSDTHQVVNRGTKNTLDQVYKLLLRWRKQGKTFGGYTIGTILWRVKSHYDHIHVELAPKKRGTPPVWKPSNEDEEVEQLTKVIQQALVDAGYELPRWGVDGAAGAETQAALTAAFKDAQNGGTGSHTHDVTVPARVIKTGRPK